jgi:Mechanosensitive ion channel
VGTLRALRSILTGLLVCSFAVPAFADTDSNAASSDAQYGPPPPPTGAPEPKAGRDSRAARPSEEGHGQEPRGAAARPVDAGVNSRPWPTEDGAVPLPPGASSEGASSAAPPQVPTPSSSAPTAVAPIAVAPTVPGQPLPAQPSTLPDAPPAPSTGAQVNDSADPPSTHKPGKVTLGERTVFTLNAPRGSKSAEERAQTASRILAKLVQRQAPGEVHAREQGNGMVVALGDTTIIALTGEDARLAGEDSADSYAQTVVTSITEAIESERQRGTIDKRVFSASLVVFFGLIAFYLLRKTGEWAESAREWLEERGDSLSIRVRQMEIVAPEVVETAALFALGALKWLLRFGIIYAWLVVALSLFESTRGYTQRLTSWVLAPLTELTERIASTLPVLVVAALALVAIWILLRFVQLLFEAVARRETTLAWVPADLARPTSVLVRLVIVLTALIFAAPVVTGNTDGPLARTGLLALLTLGLAATPLVASALVGAINVFGRRVRVGDHVEVRGRRGRVSKLGLFELCLELEDVSELRMPYIVLTWSSLRILGTLPLIEVELAVHPDASIAEAETALYQAGINGFTNVKIGLAGADCRALRFVVSVRAQRLSQRDELSKKLVEGLRAAGIKLGAVELPLASLRR